MWLFAISVLLALLNVESAPVCPADCHCLPEQQNSKEVTISCTWPSISGQDAFASFPKNVTTSLSIECDGRESKLPAELFSGFTAIRHLRLIDCFPDTGKLVNGLFSGIHQLQILHLQGLFAAPSERLEIENGVFSELNRLETLSLVNNHINQLPRTLLCDLPELKILNVSSNWLSDIGEISDHKICPSYLIVLDMSKNWLERLDINGLRSMNSLHTATFADNRLQKIHSAVFENSTNLQELYLHNNQLSAVESLPSDLRILNVARNRLESVPEIIAQSDTIIKLNLQHNRIKTPENMFYMPALQSLDLSHNALGVIESTLFENVTNLKRLNLAHNHLGAIEEGAFESLQNLAVLDLSHNLIDTLSVSQLTGLSTVSDLNLENNSLASLARNTFTATPAIRRLNLAQNLLTDVPTTFTHLYYLEILNLSQNAIKSVHKFLFDKMPNLKSLDLSVNELSKVERYIFEDIAQLSTLNLAYNQIEELSPNCFDRSRNLETIYLQNNIIGNLEGILSKLPQLKLVNLTENNLIYIDFAMVPKNLETLLIGKNRINQITNSRPDHDLSLQFLDISFNRLSQLTSELISKDLVVGNFSYNRIETIEKGAVLHRKNLIAVDLRDNLLKQVRKDSLDLGSARKTENFLVYLSNNPLLCSCDLEWIKNTETSPILSSSLPKIADYATINCSQSQTGQILQFHELSKQELMCPYEEICPNDCPCCDFESCDCKSWCPIGCTCFHDSAYIHNNVYCSATLQPISAKELPMYASEIRLDGINYPIVQTHDFLGRFRLEYLYLNNSRIRAIEKAGFKELTSLELLDLSDNFLTEISGREFYNLAKLVHLFLNNNRIGRIHAQAFASLPALRTLTLHNNYLTILPPAVIRTAPILHALTLGNNMWRCDCGDRFEIQRWLPRRRQKKIVKDASLLYCYENVTASLARNDSTVLSVLPPSEGRDVIKVNFWALRDEMNQSLCLGPGLSLTDGSTTTSPLSTLLLDQRGVIIGAVILSAALSILILALAAWWLRRRCASLGYGTNGGRSLNSSSTTTSTPIPIVPLLGHDAFVSYSADDAEWVHPLMSCLENQSPYYQLCLLNRDLPLSTCNTHHLIDDKITGEMERSSCLIIVLTQNFLKREWDLLQIKTAHKLMRDNKCRSIVVLCDDVQLDNINEDLGKIVRTSTKIRYSDDMFWVNLRGALPERTIAQDALLTAPSQYSDLYGTIVPSKFV